MSYNWNYTYVGGVPRVKIATGSDIAHLAELDEKMWTVLSCPVKGLELDEKTLSYIDTNHDGHVHVSEVVATSKWLVAVLKDMNLLVPGTDEVRLDALDASTDEGRQLLEAARRLLAAAGKADADRIALADSSVCLERAKAEKLAALKAERAALEAVEAPFGAQTEAVAAAYAALDAKVRDFFLRGRLAQFSAESREKLDVQAEQIESISRDNLTERTAEIAACPLARIGEAGVLPLDAVVNPAWTAQWDAVKTAFDADVTPETWEAVGARLKAYADYCAKQDVKDSDVALDDESKSIELVDKLLHLTRDFFTLLRNFVTLSDFYSPGGKAIFQAGRLYIDQRACDFCVRVQDAGAMAAQAAASGMYLVFCQCTDRTRGLTMPIVAAITVGDTQNISVGKNGIFYDRQGHDWDACVTAIVDNPISIGQAAWSPYRKMAEFIEEKVRSMAASKESQLTEKATASIDAKAETAAAATAEAAAAGPKAAPAAQTGSGENAAAKSFDIAKFAGIFAAIGMAIGFIGSFLTTLGSEFMKLLWWQMPLCILAIFLLISGPSMFIAWLKLRKRNISPILNANGWAVNASAKISIRFGNALSEQACFPLSAKMRGQDPFADKGLPWWQHLLWASALLLFVAAVCWFFGVFTIPGITSPYLTA